MKMYTENDPELEFCNHQLFSTILYSISNLADNYLKLTLLLKLDIHLIKTEELYYKSSMNKIKGPFIRLTDKLNCSNFAA